MPALILYLLKVNVALALFYMAYHIALRRLTFYHLNRLFLVFGIVFSTVYPFIDLSGLFTNEQQMAAAYMVTIPEWAYTTRTTTPAPEAFDYWQLPVYIFWAGVAVMLARFMLQLLSLYRIHAASEPASYKAVPFREVKSITQAFSFWQTIYLNPAQHRPEELESILRHELIHITGWHTLDVLLAELSVVFCWFNPGAWLMEKAMKENLEFIADQNVVSAGIDRKEYQYLLLKVVGAAQPQIANQFSFPSLKRRIVMMNRKQSSLLHIARYAVLIPLVAAPILFVACSEEEALPDGAAQTTNDSNMQNQTIQRIVTEEKVDASPSAQEQAGKPLTTLDADVIYYIDGEEVQNDAFKQLDPEVIHSMNVIKGENATKVFGTRARNGVISVTTKENQNAPQVLEFNKKLSAPPPPVVRNSEVIPNVEVYIPDASTAPEDYKAFLKRNPKVKHVGWSWVSGATNVTAARSIVIELNSGGSEIYDLNDEESLATVKRKYGELPALPPPPPPVRSNDK